MAALPKETCARFAFLAERFQIEEDIAKLSDTDLVSAELFISETQWRLDVNKKCVRAEQKRRASEKRIQDAATRRASQLREKADKADEVVRQKADRAESGKRRREPSRA